MSKPSSISNIAISFPSGGPWPRQTLPRTAPHSRLEVRDTARRPCARCAEVHHEVHRQRCALPLQGFNCPRKTGKDCQSISSWSPLLPLPCPLPPLPHFLPPLRPPQTAPPPAAIFQQTGSRSRQHVELHQVNQRSSVPSRTREKTCTEAVSGLPRRHARCVPSRPAPVYWHTELVNASCRSLDHRF